MQRFTGQGVVVTGAAQGIGLAIVTRFLDEGARVIAVDRNAAALEAAVAGLGPGCVPFVGDVADRADCRGAVEACVARVRPDRRDVRARGHRRSARRCST